MSEYSLVEPKDSITLKKFGTEISILMFRYENIREI